MFSPRQAIRSEQHCYCRNCGQHLSLNHYRIDRNEIRRVRCERCGYTFHLSNRKILPFRRALFTPKTVNVVLDPFGAWKWRLDRCLNEIKPVPNVVLHAYNVPSMLHLLVHLNKRIDLNILSIDTTYSYRKHCAEMLITVKNDRR